MSGEVEPYYQAARVLPRRDEDEWRPEPVRGRHAPAPTWRDYAVPPPPRREPYHRPGWVLEAEWNEMAGRNTEAMLAAYAEQQRLARGSRRDYGSAAVSFRRFVAMLLLVLFSMGVVFAYLGVAWAPVLLIGCPLAMVVVVASGASD